MNKQQEKEIKINKTERCSVCGGMFCIPLFPKVLPCLHLICRNCLISCKEAQKENGDYFEEESEILCFSCNDYVVIPNNIDYLPTAHKLMENIYLLSTCEYCNDRECIDDNRNNYCGIKSFGYCFDCKKCFCSQHLFCHAHDYSKHSVEIFSRNRYCENHLFKADNFCLNCQKYICGECQCSEHKKHNIISANEYKNLYFSKKENDLNSLYKMINKISFQNKRAASIYDTLYLKRNDYHKEVSLCEMEKQIEIIEQMKQKLINDGENIISFDVETIISTFLKYYQVKLPANPTFSKININKYPIIVEIDKITELNVILLDMFMCQTNLCGEVNINMKPIKEQKRILNMPLIDGIDYQKEIIHDLFDENEIEDVPNTGEIEISLLKIKENGLLTLNLKGKHEGDLLLRIYLDKTEIENSPVRIYVRKRGIEKINLKNIINKEIEIGGIKINGTDIFISDILNNCIYKYDIKTQKYIQFGKKGKENGEFNYPCGICINDNNGNINNKTSVFIVDKYNNRIQEFTYSGQFKKSIGKYGNIESCLNNPSDICYSEKTKSLYITDTNNNRISIYSLENKNLSIYEQGNKKEKIEIKKPFGICYSNRNGNIIFTDTYNSRILSLKRNENPIIKGKYESKTRRGMFSFPKIICTTEEGNVFVGEEEERIQQFNKDLKFIGEYKFGIGKIKRIDYDNKSKCLVITNKEEILIIPEELLDLYYS